MNFKLPTKFQYTSNLASNDYEMDLPIFALSVYLYQRT